MRMDEPRDEEVEERPPARPTEGVRIIGAEEAQAAIESGAVAGRRPDDEPRFGDVPEAPAGPRPPLRFPLGAGADPAEVTRSVRGGGAPDEEPGTGDLRWQDDTAATELPHWTEPPSGETPRVGDDDDLGAWSSFAQGPRWRDHPADWDEVHADDPMVWAGDERVPTPEDRPPPDEPFVFDDTAPREAPPARIRSRPRREAPTPPAPGRGPGRDVGMAVAVGLGIGAVVLLMLRYLENLGGVLVAGVALTVASIELVNALSQRGFRPAKLLVWVGTAATTWAAYARGEQAVPLLVALFAVFSLLWYLFGVETRQPATNAAVSLLAYVYVGVLGAFAALTLRWAPGHHADGTGIFLGGIIATVGYDVGGFFIGSRAGHTPLAPAISPNKTWEGLIGGSFCAFAASVLVVTQIHPWDLRHAFALGVVAAVLAPLGDLCESMLKRDLGIKDMGSLLPEHGGVLDRIDAMLFVVPAVYFLAKLLDIGLT
jgi:phosphatidate cytidylyltransferase